jgi:CO/xanthine dehydrogenase FAD-binding subunit
MSPITEYHRPQTLDEALALLQRDGAVPLAGGTHLVPARSPDVQAVVDLQALGLDELSGDECHLHLGAMVRLQRLVESPGQVGEFMAEAAHLEGPLTYRHAATVGGTIATADPLSSLLIALLVLDAEVHLCQPLAVRLSAHAEAPSPLPPALSLDRLLEDPREVLDGQLITGVTALSPVTAPGVALARVARTPRDKPIVAVAVRVAAAGPVCGDVRIALAGVAGRPIRAYAAEEQLKGQPLEKGRVDGAVAAALEKVDVPSDFRGSSEYRCEMAAVLTWRALLEACEKLA